MNKLPIMLSLRLSGSVGVSSSAGETPQSGSLVKEFNDGTPKALKIGISASRRGCLARFLGSAAARPKKLSAGQHERPSRTHATSAEELDPCHEVRSSPSPMFTTDAIHWASVVCVKSSINDHSLY